MNFQRHYFDYAATAPMLPESRDAYLNALETVGNPSSIHTHGQQAKMILEESREILAAGLSADPIELIFTSGGTESINTAIKGIFHQRQLDRERPIIVLPDGEHHATFESVQWLEKFFGAEIRWIPTTREAVIDLDALAETFEKDADRIALMTLLWANNEVGTIQPISEVAELAAKYGIPLHVDAVAAYGHIPVGFTHPGISAVSFTSHKIGGPVGVGGLLVRRSLSFDPLLHGGSHERKMRSGSQPVAAAVGFAEAFRAGEEKGVAQIQQVRDRLIELVREKIPEAVSTIADAETVSSNAHFLFPEAEGDVMLFLLDQAGFSVSTGSACQAGVPEVSHVLIAMGYSEDEAKTALRFTFGHGNTVDEVEKLMQFLPEIYQQAKKAQRR